MRRCQNITSTVIVLVALWLHAPARGDFVETCLSLTGIIKSEPAKQVTDAHFFTSEPASLASKAHKSEGPTNIDSSY